MSVKQLYTDVTCGLRPQHQTVDRGSISGSVSWNSVPPSLYLPSFYSVLSITILGVISRPFCFRQTDVTGSTYHDLHLIKQQLRQQMKTHVWFGLQARAM